MLGYARFRFDTANIDESENPLNTKKAKITENDINKCRCETVDADGCIGK